MRLLAHLVKNEEERIKETKMNLCRLYSCPKIIFKWKLMKSIVMSNNPLSFGVCWFVCLFWFTYEEYSAYVKVSSKCVCLMSNIKTTGWFCIFKSMVPLRGCFSHKGGMTS